MLLTRSSRTAHAAIWKPRRPEPPAPDRPAAEYRDSRHARGQLVDGLERLRSTAAEMARQDVSAIVESFGQLGRRRFQMAL